MKKSLLFLASLFMTVGMFAQWTKPVPKASAEYKYSVLADSLRGDSTIYYLYNKDAKAFLTQGNAWGTQASFADTGLKYMVSKYVAEGEEWDGKTVLLSDYVETKTAWFLLFIDDETHAYVDRGSQPNYLWEIDAKGNGIYNIKGAAKNPEYNTPSYLFGIDSNTIESGATTISPYIDPVEDLGAQVDWQFISEADYAEYLAKLAPYQAAEKLGKLIELAKEKYSSINTAAAEKVYANTSSTLEELNAAYDNINDAIKKIEFGDATEDNPKDCTEWLVNADFSEGNANGWTCTFESGKNATNIGYQSASYSNGEVKINGFIEAWTPNAMNENIPGVNAIGVGKLSQTIKNMPQGKYRLTADCIANAQNVASNNPVKGVQLFATGGDLDVSSPIATGNGAPEHFELIFINDGDDIEMGLRTTAECVANWIAADNFTLTYYGPSTEDPEKIMLDEQIKSALTAYPEEGMDELIATQAVKDALISTIETAQAATEGYTEQKEAVKAAKDALDKSVEAYNAYVDKIDEIRIYLTKDNLDSPKGELLADYVAEGNEAEPDEDNPYGSADYILANLIPTTEQIKEETKRVEILFKAAIAESLYEGKDCSNLLTNNDFSAGDQTGWTVNVNPTNFAWTGGLLNVPVCESWHSYFDISQEVTAPDGIYAISLNGFCRLDDGVDSEVPAEVYINNFSSKLMNINEDPISEEEAVDGYNAYLSNGTAGAWTQNPIFQKKDGSPCDRKSPADNTDSQVDGGYVPNGMEGASVAFSAGRYQAVAYGLCEGGKLTIGVRNRVSTHVWALWGNFKLTYMDKNLEALQSILPSYVEQLSNFGEENADALTDPTVKSIEDAVIKANNAVEAEEMYQALITVNSTLVAAKENKAAVDAFLAEHENLTAVVEQYPGSEAEYNKIADEIDGYAALSTEGVKALTEKMKDVKKSILLGSASEENPADVSDLFIVNPRFDEGNINGWTDTFTAGNHGFQNNATYGTEGQIDQFMEAWIATPSKLANGSLSQDITLPTGSYVLSADIIAKDQANGEEVVGMYLFVGENRISVNADSENPGNYEIAFVLAEPATVTIGVVVEETNGNWLAADNFTLMCKGADVTAIKEVINSASASNGIYTVSGARVNKLQKGINIVKMADGTVNKVMVK